MRKLIKNRAHGKKFLLKAGALLFLWGFLLFNATEASAQISSGCNPGSLFSKSTIEAPLFDSNNEQMAWGSFSLLLTGERYIGADITPSSPLPTNTILRVSLNGVQLPGNMFRWFRQGQEWWSWYDSDIFLPYIARVGDVMTITKDGQPYLSGVFRRQSYSWAHVGGNTYIENSGRCAMAYGYVYLATHPEYPRRLSLTSISDTSSPVTRITINEPNLPSGETGAEIASLTIRQVNPPSSDGWRSTNANNSNMQLTEDQYNKLRAGQLTLNVYTETHPGGFLQMPLTVFYVNAVGDFEGDGKADLAVFRPSEQNWYVLYSSTNQLQSVQFGLPTDKIVIGDYDHDGKTDITGFQIDNPDYQGLGVWKILNSNNGSTSTIQWGLNTDIPLSMDIDGNNTSDLTIFRPSSGTWYIFKMGDIIKPRNSQQTFSRYVIIPWGMAGDKPLAGDFNGDGKEEIAVFRPSEGNWYIYDAENDSYRIIHWGLNGDIPIAKDFDGDTLADITVFRPSDRTWYILSSLDGSLLAQQFGLSDDIPVPADFDKDGATDIAVYRPSNGTWYVLRSSDNSFFSTQFGANGDIPASTALR